MHVVYQITFYELRESYLLSAFLKSEAPYPVMLLGDTFYAKDFAGLETFSPRLEIVHFQQYISTFSQAETQHQLLVFTQAYHPVGTDD